MLSKLLHYLFNGDIRRQHRHIIGHYIISISKHYSFFLFQFITGHLRYLWRRPVINWNHNDRIKCRSTDEGCWLSNRHKWELLNSVFPTSCWSSNTLLTINTVNKAADDAVGPTGQRSDDTLYIFYLFIYLFGLRHSTCHSRKSTSVINTINYGCIPFISSSSRPPVLCVLAGSLHGWLGHFRGTEPSFVS